MGKIVLKCKCCGNTIGTFTFSEKFYYEFKCKKCKHKNTGCITEKNKRDKKRHPPNEGAF